MSFQGTCSCHHTTLPLEWEMEKQPPVGIGGGWGGPRKHSKAWENPVEKQSTAMERAKEMTAGHSTWWPDHNWQRFIHSDFLKHENPQDNFIHPEVRLKRGHHIQKESADSIRRPFTQQYSQEIDSLFKDKQGTSLTIHWLRLHAPNAGVLSSIPGQETRSCMLQLRPSAAK